MLLFEVINMNFIQVNGFILTAKYNSFTAAAKDLNIHQQNFTLYMRNLERELGVSLFVSNARGTQLTEKGKQLLPVFKELSSNYSVLLNYCHQKKTLNIGVDSIFIQPLLLDCVNSYEKYSSNSNLNIISKWRYYELPEKLKDGDIDLCFGYYRADLDSFGFHELFTDSVCISCGNNQFTGKKNLVLKDLEGCTIYYDDANLYKNRILLNRLKQKDIKFIGIAGEADSIIDLHVSKGDGVMIIHSLYIPTLAPNLTALPVRGLRVPYGIFYRKNETLVQHFLHCIT